MTRAVNLANLADTSILKVDGANDRVGIGSTQPTGKLDISGDTNITSGNLFVTDGGLQVSGITTILGSLNANNTLDSVGILTGALATLGGLAVVKSANIGGNLNITGGNLFVTNGGLQVSGITTILGSLNASSTLDSTGIHTGALATLGGLAVVKSANIGGNLSVGGTLTYEDVTNVDSVGIVTARTGIKVLAGGINAVGVVTATTFSGNTIGAAATFTTDVKIGTETATALSDRLLQVGDTSRSATYVEVRTSTSGASGVVFSDGVDSSDKGYRGTIEYAHSSDQLTFKAAGGTRVTIDGTGNLGATGNVSDSIGPMRRLGIHAGAGVNFGLTTGHAGYLSRATASGITVTVPANTLTAGDMCSVFNVSTGNISIAPAGGVTMYNTADGATGTRTLAAKGLVTILCSGTNEFLITGTGLS